ncbi:MAG: hypothetical protein EOP35_04165 [Rubrivivax sp.]|nr:MAG: hypothetical protein EOP35_04165 [Rubrivivax sp.]
MVLKLVPPADPPAPSVREAIGKRIAAETPAYLLKCPRCAGMELIETVTGVEVTKSGGHRRGTKTKICLSCFMQGQRIEVL